MPNQTNTPLADALFKNASRGYIPFDVPGHKGNSEALCAYFGERCIALDKNSRHDIDYLCQPNGVIRQAEELAAEAFGARHAFFMVGGTTSCIQAMIMSAGSYGDKIILPRNVHISVLNAVILAGMIPVYVNPSIDARLGISLGMSLKDVRDCIMRNTDARAIVVNNPTYYGICPNIKAIVELAHSYGILVLADEAHGTHFYFNKSLPATAIGSGADMSAVSMHKTGGSLTQSSILLSSGSVSAWKTGNIINLTQTTSASYLLMASLDIARRELVVNGAQRLDGVIAAVARARGEINALGGYYAFGDDTVNGDCVYAFDPTKLSVNTAQLGLTGSEVYALLRDEFGIQLEFGDVGNFLAIGSIGDCPGYYERLVSALQQIKAYAPETASVKKMVEYISPIVKMPPQKAYYSAKRQLSVKDSVGSICACAVMCYPPGIPLVAPGELITGEIVEHILFASEKGCQISGLVNDSRILVVCE